MHARLTNYRHIRSVSSLEPGEREQLVRHLLEQDLPAGVLGQLHRWDLEVEGDEYGVWFYGRGRGVVYAANGAEAVARIRGFVVDTERPELAAGLRTAQRALHRAQPELDDCVYLAP